MADGDNSGRTLSAQQERFCRFIVEGKNQRDAYIEAGYKTTTDGATDANASRLLSNAKIASRIAELRNGAAKRTELTAAYFAKRLERLAAAAERSAFPTGEDGEVLTVSPKEAADIARQCTMDAAKLLGQVIDQSRVQSENVNYTIGDKPMSEDEWEREFGDADAMGSAAGSAARAH